ncbi:MauE/DoxX family redox-associated membrane protein [Streptomyces sp. KL118A]|uniref:MauE/DoxX family redox-associated membrane protein n=1 Tax=Streptomyces sp. KL118A TaxID=3045153 RepID=UPI00278BCB71|nr:MauE/DoxX family redox-associated membrane protein [Streptomyces sp. KL118A]
MTTRTPACPASATPDSRDRARRTVPGITAAARVALAVVWCWAGWAKIQDPAASAQAVRAYRILPETLVAPVGHGIPALELTLAALLLVGLRIRLAAVLSALLLAGFLAGIVQAWARGLSVDCGCFGGGGEIDSADTRYLQEVLRDVGLLLLSTWLVRWPASRFSLDAVLR